MSCFFGLYLLLSIGSKKLFYLLVRVKTKNHHQKNFLMSRPTTSTRSSSPPGSPTFRRQTLSTTAGTVPATVPAGQRARILAEQQRRSAQTPGTFSITNAAASPTGASRTTVRRTSVPSATGVAAGSPRAAAVARPASPTGASVPRPGSPTGGGRKSIVVASPTIVVPAPAIIPKDGGECKEDNKCETKCDPTCQPVECKQTCNNNGGDGDCEQEHSKCECAMEDCHCESSDEGSCSDDDKKCEQSCSSKDRVCKTKSAKAKANGLDPQVVKVPAEIAFPTDADLVKTYKAAVVARIQSRLAIHPGTAALLTEGDLGTLIDSVLVAFPKFSVLYVHEMTVHVAQLINSVPVLIKTPLARQTIAHLLIQSMVEQLYALQTPPSIPPSVAVQVSHVVSKLYTSIEPVVQSGALTLAIMRKADLDHQTLVTSIKTQVAAQKKARLANKAKAKSVKKAAKKAKAKAAPVKKDAASSAVSNSFCCGKVEDN